MQLTNHDLRHLNSISILAMVSKLVLCALPHTGIDQSKDFFVGTNLVISRFLNKHFTFYMNRTTFGI